MYIPSVSLPCVSVLVLIFIILTQRNKPEHRLINPDDDYRDNYVTYEEEGAGRSTIHTTVSTSIITHPVVAMVTMLLLLCHRGGGHAGV